MHISARQKLLKLLKDWVEHHWPADTAPGEQQDEQLKLQGEAWLLQQVKRWDVDDTGARSHKLKVCHRPNFRALSSWGFSCSQAVETLQPVQPTYSQTTTRCDSSSAW